MNQRRPGFDSLQGQRINSLCHRFHNGSGIHPPSYPVGTGGRVERSESEADHPSPSVAEVKNA